VEGVTDRDTHESWCGTCRTVQLAAEGPAPPLGTRARQLTVAGAVL
jgi:hypothetical protein